MPTSQRVLFQIGGWACVVLAIFHFIGFLQQPQPSNDTERTLMELMNTYKMNLLGVERSMSDLLNGFSLSFSLFNGFIGALSLAALRSQPSQPLIRTLSLINTLGFGALVALSLSYWFWLPTSFLVVILISFAGSFVAASTSTVQVPVAASSNARK